MNSTDARQNAHDAVFIEPDSIRAVFTAIPHEPADSDPAWIKHVYCEGARFHVLSYSTQGVRCSEPRCIKNKPQSVESGRNADNASYKPKSGSVLETEGVKGR